MIVFAAFLIITTVFLKVLCVDVDPDEETTTQSDIFCRQRTRPVTSDKDDLFNFVEAVCGETIRLQCHFCGENDDGIAKNWLKIDPMNDHVRYEVTLGMDNNMTLNRVHLDMFHTLTIHNVSEDDGGEYFCKGLEDEDAEDKYNFFVDATDVEPETGDLAKWRQYHDEQFTPINMLLKSAEGPDFTYLRKKMNLDSELVTEWDMAGPCEVCGRPKGDGRRKKKGHCRFKFLPRDQNKKIKAKNHLEKILQRATHLSCRSMTLYKLIPEIINKTIVIPDFVEIEKCDGTCNPDAEGIYKGWKSTKKTGFKYRKTFVLAENAHLTLVCPDSTLENEVVWKFNGKTLHPGENIEAPSENVEPRITVDSFNTLYLYAVTDDEEGNYTCFVDKIRMQNVMVFVVSKSKLLTQAFVRHMMYLAFVLSLTSSCYCAGLVITCVRRSKFKTYEEILEDIKLKRRTRFFMGNKDIEKGNKGKEKATARLNNTPVIITTEETRKVTLKSSKEDATKTTDTYISDTSSNISSLPTDDKTFKTPPQLKPVYEKRGIFSCFRRRPKKEREWKRREKRALKGKRPEEAKLLEVIETDDDDEDVIQDFLGKDNETTTDASKIAAEEIEGRRSSRLESAEIGKVFIGQRAPKKSKRKKSNSQKEDEKKLIDVTGTDTSN